MPANSRPELVAKVNEAESGAHSSRPYSASSSAGVSSATSPEAVSTSTSWVELAGTAGRPSTTYRSSGETATSPTYPPPQRELVPLGARGVVLDDDGALPRQVPPAAALADVGELRPVPVRRDLVELDGAGVVVPDQHVPVGGHVVRAGGAGVEELGERHRHAPTLPQCGTRCVPAVDQEVRWRPR